MTEYEPFWNAVVLDKQNLWGRRARVKNTSTVMKIFKWAKKWGCKGTIIYQSQLQIKEQFYMEKFIILMVPGINILLSA